MSLPPCKIITGTPLNIEQNKNNPLGVLDANYGSLNRLIHYVTQSHPRICFVGSSCMYPVKGHALTEDMLGDGQVFEGNSLYAQIKLLGWEICKAAVKQNRIQCFMVIPSDIFGEPKGTHFISQMIAKFHYAKHTQASKVTFWGTGTPIRHPIYDEDYGNILNQVCDTYGSNHALNIAPPVSYAKSVTSIALDIREVVGYSGDIEWDASHSDGQQIKILDNTRLTRLGYSGFTPFKESLEKAYKRFLGEA